MDTEAATHNSRLLEEAGFNLDSLIEANRHTTLNYGSKFRLTQDLSFSLTEEKASVNSQIFMEEYTKMIKEKQPLSSHRPR